MINRKNLFLIILSALLMSLSFHPINLYFLAWIGLLPLLLAIDNLRISAVFKSGLLFGFLFALCSLFWIVFLEIGTNIKILIIFGLVILFLYIGLYFGVALLIAKRIGIWSLPFIVVGFEFIRGIGELGFPWLSLGYTQARYPIIIQQASIYGVYGISFWLVLLNVSLYFLIKDRKIKNLMTAILIFVLPLIYGTLRLSESSKHMISIGIVQPNIDPNLKFSRALRDKTFERFINLSIKCALDGVKKTGDSLSLIIWPETATPVFLKSPGKYQDIVFALSNKINIPIFTGTAIYEPKNHEVFNGAVLIEPGAGIVQEYKKIHLVPFGEHIPFDRYVPLFAKIDFGEGDYSPGEEYTVFEVNNLKFSCLICFESIFPQLSREFVKRGADILINITNDGWFGKISGPQQHNDMAILRTVENGVTLLRSANTGISMVVDQYGRIKEERGLFIEDYIVAAISINRVKTLYQRIGYLFPILSLILITMLLIRIYILEQQAQR